MRLFVLLFLIICSQSFAASSREARSNKKYEVTAQAGVDYRLSPTQLAGMYFIDPNNLIGAKVGVDRVANERQTSIALQYKHYTGNSFYFAGETFYLNTREDVNWILGDIFNVREIAEYTSLGAGIRIGNQWTWKYVTFGCDWIGIGHRFGTFKKETQKLDDTTYTLFNFIIGASF